MRYVKESRIAASPERVFAFHEEPGAILKITPPWEKVEVVSGGESIKAGSRVVLRTHLGPIPLTWVAEHTEYEPGKLFADRQVSGPFSSWYHRHEFLPDGEGGTILRDDVQFTPPGGWLGRTLGRRFILKKLDRMFDYRHRATKAAVEVGP